MRSLQDKGTPYTIHWRIASRCQPYCCDTRWCDLTEKTLTLSAKNFGEKKFRWKYFRWKKFRWLKLTGFIYIILFIIINPTWTRLFFRLERLGGGGIECDENWELKLKWDLLLVSTWNFAQLTQLWFHCYLHSFKLWEKCSLEIMGYCFLNNWTMEIIEKSLL